MGMVLFPWSIARKHPQGNIEWPWATSQFPWSSGTAPFWLATPNRENRQSLMTWVKCGQGAFFIA
jgi:hypothetical protein